MKSFERQIIDSREYRPAIEKALLETYFLDYDKHFLHSQEGRRDIENNVFRRYEHALRHVVPWLRRQKTLSGAKVLEIGSGTGSSTAALAHYVDSVNGYDIHQPSLAGARRRMQIMGLENVRLHLVAETDLVERIQSDTDGLYDIILLYAVLEHQTIAERHATLKKCWELLQEEGVLAVVDTPNILHYFDLHSSKLPFLHMLPDRLYAGYASKSSREAFADSFAEIPASAEELEVKIARWGRGVSFHDFELVFGTGYSDLLVAEGFEPEILDWFPCTVEEELLRWYVEHKEFAIPAGFTRCVLNLIFKKSAERSRSDNIAAPPSFSSLQDFAPGRLLHLEAQLQEQADQIRSIYRSKTWRAGRIVAGPYHFFHNILRG
jgi:S-adenosylmethionine-dependent methyltransferase